MTTRNEHTCKLITTAITPTTDAYRENWERIFGGNKVSATEPTPNKPPWHDWPVNKPVMVRLRGHNWIRAYFKGVSSEGYPLTYAYGRNSWTGQDFNEVGWDEIREPVGDELP